MNYSKKIPLLMWILILFLAYPSIADACPTCKDSLEEQWISLQQGYALSILLMMGMPFSIAIVWGVAIWRMIKKGQAGSL